MNNKTDMTEINKKLELLDNSTPLPTEVVNECIEAVEGYYRANNYQVRMHDVVMVMRQVRSRYEQ